MGDSLLLRQRFSHVMDTQTMGMIGLAVLFLASVMVAFFSAKSWHWGHVVIVLFLFLGGLGAAILSAEVLKIRGVYERMAAEKDAELKEKILKNQALEFGSFEDQVFRDLLTDLEDPDKDTFDGNVTLASRLKTVTRSRGRVWRGMEPAGKPDPQTGDVARSFPPPVEGEAPRGNRGLEPDGIVFVFEEGMFDPQNPLRYQYLGEFQIVKADAGGVTISPMLIHSWSDKQRARLANSQTTWSLYETMPTDRHDLFAFPGLPPENRTATLNAILPNNSASEYIRDGQTANGDDDPKHVFPFSRDGRPLTEKEASDAEEGEVEKRFVRPLRAYGFLFSELANARVVMLAELDAIGNDTQRLAETTKSAQADYAARSKEKEETEHDLSGFRRDNEAAKAYMGTVQSLRDRAAAMLTTTLGENSRLASELAATHLRIIESLQ